MEDHPPSTTGESPPFKEFDCFGNTIKAMPPAASRLGHAQVGLVARAHAQVIGLTIIVFTGAATQPWVKTQISTTSYLE